MDFEEGEREKREGSSPRFGNCGGGEMIEEREGGGKRGFLLLWPHGLTPGVTGQSGDGHRSDRWPPKVEPVSPYRFFRPTLGRTDDLDKFDRESLSVEPTRPR
jgi:hypothetical protein